MALAIISALLIFGAGVLALRLLGIERGAIGLGLAPAGGVALLAILSVWGLTAGVPPNVEGLGVLGISLTGLALELRDLLARGGYRRVVHQRAAVAMLIAALVICIVVLSPAVFVRAGVPDYVLDGSTHAEFVDALRRGIRLEGYDWYPIGFHAPIASLLALAPSIDSASGAVSWGLGLTLLAPLALFGLSSGIWRDPRVSAAGALVLALTSAYPYGTQLYSFWPMAAGVLLVLGSWTTSLLYLDSPRLRLALFGGLLAGAVMLTHGTEIYSVAIGLAVFAASRWRRIASWRAARQLSLALAVAVLVVLPYVSVLVGWAASGGTVAFGSSFFDYRHHSWLSDPLNEALFWTSAVSSGFLVDFLPRVALFALGGWLALRQRTGRGLLVLAMIYTICVGLSRYADVALVRNVYALTLPWAVDDRLIVHVSILLAPLGGLGLVRLADGLAGRSSADASPPHRFLSWRRGTRLANVLAFAGGLMSVFFVTERFSLQTGGIVTYAADDKLAIAWLLEHAQPGDLLMNDGAADAGIWVPYKANLPIVLPRTRSVAADGPESLLRADLGEIDTALDVRNAACLLGVHYIFRGEANSRSEHRQFPELSTLRQLRSLEEVFSSGQSAVFQLHLNCQPS